MGELSVIQIVIVLVIALLVFGPARLPELGRQLGKGLRELRRHASSVTEDLGRSMDEDDAAPTPPARPPSAATPPPADDDGDILNGVVVGPDAAPPVANANADAAAGDDDILAGVVVSGDAAPEASAP